MKNRFYVPQQLPIGETVELTGDEFHHAVRVHRSRVGEEVELFDGKGHVVAARIDSITKSSASLVVLADAAARESPLEIQLALALIQLDRFELVLQKGTELGVAVFIPVITDHAEVRPERVTSKFERWRKIILEATKQSGRAVVPRIDEPATFRDVIGRPGARVIFEAEQVNDVVSPDGKSITLLIGPEGGWSEEELEAARRSGCAFRSLGPRRLRAETAAIAAVTLVGLTAGDLSS